MSKEKKLEYSNFNTYPHYVYATAFLVNGELADYKIQDRERCWEERTFRGNAWENEVWQHGFIDKDWDLTFEYNKILVNNDKEHNNAFELLEMWLDNKFKKYKNINLIFAYERAKHELIEEDTIDIDGIKETEIKNDGMKYFEYENNGATESGYSKNYSAGDIETRIKINELVQAVKQLNKEIKNIKEK